MRVISIASLAGLSLVSVASWAADNCQPDNLTRPQQVACLHQDEQRYGRQADALYAALRKAMPPKDAALLDKSHKTWKASMDADCQLTMASVDGWGRDSTPDGDFQSAACRAAAAENRVDFYKTLLCPDTLATGDEPNCKALQSALTATDKK
ncbi:MAG: DUF1311 domain-containing protein [Paludibacterium sp.]|uniref:lysozyme inhibitor LprI family protein n=1 Tax=Paludibacterium sp. TaxID=1917523 RepID=UPI0025DACCB9|nr:lysozyme inhibitor LprI family protein [Paludibacterium sp.]MBV8048426.1 DUF1311 domain-containing protein [Paludibacterium sp.]MBV8647033.1 DUF1311 domain-containing protein [Paludibacterium sp.]